MGRFGSTWVWNHRLSWKKEAGKIGTSFPAEALSKDHELICMLLWSSPRKLQLSCVGNREDNFIQWTSRGRGCGADRGSCASLVFICSLISESWAIVGAVKKRCRDRSICKHRRRRDRTCMASREWPPKAKKLSCIPTCAILSTWAQLAAIASCKGVCGITKLDSSPRELYSGASKARRFTFPLGVNGNASTSTNTEGTM